MSDSGSGIGTPVDSPSSVLQVYDQMEELLTTPNCAVSLSRYAKIIGFEEAAFWGVLYDNQYLNGCDRPLWNEYQRMSIQIALAEAQQEIEQVIGYPLCPTYISGTYNDNPRWFDQQQYKNLIVARYSRILEAGIPAVETVGLNETVTHDASGISTVGPIATSAQHAYEIKIYYPNSDREITPSKVTIAGGEVTIEIPRYRLVKQEFLNFMEGGVQYKILGNFLAEVDVKRIYTDPSTQAVFVRPNCRNNQCVGGCYECTHAGCIYIRDPLLGILNVRPAIWDADAEEWKTTVPCYNSHPIVRLNYLAGVRALDLQAEIAIIRLAHTKVGHEPCGCSQTNFMWQKDNSLDGAITRERVNCPFGPSLGAWIAYKWALTFAGKRASIL